MRDCGRIRYLVTDKKDIFFTDTLIKLDFSNYLRWLKEKNGYADVWTIRYDEKDGKIEVSCFDEQAKSICEDLVPPSGFWGVRQAFTENEKKGCFSIKQNRENMLFTLRQLRNKDRYAFVLSPDSYEQLFREKSLFENGTQCDMFIVCNTELKNMGKYSNAFQAYDKEAESEVVEWKIQQMKYLIQRFCLESVKNAQSENELDLYLDLLGDKGISDGRNDFNLSGFARSMSDNLRDWRLVGMSIDTRQMLYDELFKKNLFLRFWNKYKGV